jgi:PIN domain nuclease of toxin-antitoxin system
MRLLLDTHVALAIVGKKSATLPARIQPLLSDPAGDFYVSVASLWEIAIKYRLGKLQIAVGLALLPDALARTAIAILPITERHALAGVHPEPQTRDPFDRMLLAQCQVEGLKLVTVDRALSSHPAAALP